MKSVNDCTYLRPELLWRYIRQALGVQQQDSGEGVRLPEEAPGHLVESGAYMRHFVSSNKNTTADEKWEIYWVILLGLIKYKRLQELLLQRQLIEALILKTLFEIYIFGGFYALLYL